MIANNWKEVQARIRAAASRAGRNPQEVACMAVTKTFPPERIREAYQAGLRLFGENRVQEFAHKWPAVQDLPGAEWHMIGHLQSNKAAKAAELFAAIDSLDSLHLAEKLNLSARLLGRKLPVLIEINMGEEAAKSGLAAESPALQELLEKARSPGISRPDGHSAIHRRSGTSPILFPATAGVARSNRRPRAALRRHAGAVHGDVARF